VRLARVARNEATAYLDAIVGGWPGVSGARIRAAYWARRLARLGTGAAIGRGLLVHGPRNVTIGDRFTCWRDCVIAACDDGRVEIGDRVGLNQGVYVNACIGGRISIGSDVIVGPYTVMRTSDHRFSDPARAIADQGHEPGVIVVEDDVWIAANVTVLGDVRVGRGSVIAAGAVVTHDVEPFSVVAGVPARFLRRRGDDLASASEEGAS
jgi:galactoside O-acetyltransferase